LVLKTVKRIKIIAIFKSHNGRFRQNSHLLARTVGRKSSIGGLNAKTQFMGAKPTKAPRGDGPAVAAIRFNAMNL